MEKTLYDSSGDAVKRKKDSMTLDFSVGTKKARTQELREGLLSSPDVNLLKLATPELERFIIHPNHTLVSTPTQILFPKTVTEEQEAYARGFLDALVELHMKKSPLATSTGIVRVDGQGSSYVTLSPCALPSPLQANMNTITAIKAQQLLPSPILSHPSIGDLSTLRLLQTVPPLGLASPLQAFRHFPASSIESPLQESTAESSSSNLTSPTTTVHNVQLTSIDSGTSKGSLGDSVQTVPATPPISPIDMTDQERIKLERKREKNRTAAQKCRYKKLERISRLETRVKELKMQNARLQTLSDTTRQHVNHLRQQIVDHVNGGCQIMVVRDSTTAASSS